MSGYSDYEKLMAEWGSAYLMPIVKNKESTLIDSSKHKSFSMIFYGFTEISNTFEALSLSEVLIAVAPPRSNRINHDEYLKYLVNTYLQDVYILKERLNTYATRLKRLYTKAGRVSLVSKHINPLFEFVKSSLEDIVKTRGYHVHASRYRDDELDRVCQMALISRYDPEAKKHYRFSYQKAQKAWAARIKSNNASTKKLLDYYFKEISKVVSENGNVFMSL